MEVVVARMRRHRENIRVDEAEVYGQGRDSSLEERGRIIIADQRRWLPLGIGQLSEFSAEKGVVVPARRGKVGLRFSVGSARAEWEGFAMTPVQQGWGCDRQANESVGKSVIPSIRIIQSPEYTVGKESRSTMQAIGLSAVSLSMPWLPLPPASIPLPWHKT